HEPFGTRYLKPNGVETFVIIDYSADFEIGRGRSSRSPRLKITSRKKPLGPSRPIAAPSKSTLRHNPSAASLRITAASDHHQHRFRVLLSICPLPYSVVLTGDGRNGESRVALPPFSYYSAGFGCKGGGGTSGWRQSVPAVLALMYTFLRTGAGSSRENFSDQVKRKCFRAPSRKMSLVAVARCSARSKVLVTTRTRKFLIPNLRSWRPRSR